MRRRRTSTYISIAFGVLVVAAPATVVGGQDGTEPGRATFTLAPSLSITDLGVDTNVLSTPDPRADTVGRFTMGAEPSSHLGRVDVRGKASLSFAYFRQYPDQRSVDTDDMGRIDVHVNRVTLFGSASVLRTGNVLSAEFDVRTKQLQSLFRGGGEVRLSDRTILTGAAAQSYIKYDSDEVLFDASVREEMNRAVGIFAAELRSEVTPLTTVAVLGDVQRDRFEFSPIRDTTGLRLLAGFEFKPTAVIDGKAYAGYRVFHPLDPGALNLGTVVVSADVGYTLAEAWRFEAGMHRDLAHSYSLTERYYVVTDVRGTVTRRITPEWDLTGTIGRQYLTYRYDWIPPGTDLTGATGTVPVDHLVRCGVGVLYRFGHTSTFGVNVESYRRNSTLSGLYDRTRIVSSVGMRF